MSLILLSLSLFLALAHTQDHINPPLQQSLSLNLSNYKDYKLPFVVQVYATFDLNSVVEEPSAQLMDLLGRNLSQTTAEPRRVEQMNPDLMMENEEISLIADINSYVTVIYTDNNFKRTHYLKIPQHKDPLHGVFRRVQIWYLLSDGDSSRDEDWKDVNITCFLARARGNYTYLGHNGYLGLAPLPAKYQEYSFLWQVRQRMGVRNALGISYRISKIEGQKRLGEYTGKLVFQSMDNGQLLDELRANFTSPKIINLPALPDSIISELKSEPFYNTLTINLTQFLTSMRISQFEAFDNETYQLEQLTYLNISDIGLKINQEMYQYFNRSYLEQLCIYNETSTTMRTCACRGNNFQGMPDLGMKTAQGMEYLLEPPDYLLFPRISQSTRQTRCSLSLFYQRYLDMSDPLQPFRLKDYVLGQSFLAKFNPTFVVHFQDDSNSLALSVYIEKGTPTSTPNNYLIASCTLCLILLSLASLLTKKKALRLHEQVMRWRTIKELEEDYDVYVSDEYAYHITELKYSMEQLQNLENIASAGVQTNSNSNSIPNQSSHLLRSSIYSSNQQHTKNIFQSEQNRGQIAMEDILRLSEMQKAIAKTKRSIVSEELVMGSSVDSAQYMKFD